MLKKTSGKMPRRTRIIATLGPASNDETMIGKLLEAGVNIIRLNMSHGSHADHETSFHLVRKVAAEQKRHVAIFCDLCGPKIRVGELDGGEMLLKPRSEVIITTRTLIGKNHQIPCQYSALHKDVEPGQRVLLDDGKLELKVVSISGKDITCRVVYGGILRNKKGINLPDSHVSSSSLTANDRKDAEFAVRMGADFIALSFVRTSRDVQQLKKLLKRLGHDTPIIAKIEKPEALDNIDEIIEESYAIMVARGDLGIEIDAARVPMAQRELINKARANCRPVIVATQMMESMIHDSRPTRAEVGDVSNAALLGADAVMLSGETSVGKYPLQAVRYMAHILEEMESWQRHHPLQDDEAQMNATQSPRRAMADAAISITANLGLYALFIPTSSGTTCAVVSAFRPCAPCYGICHDDAIARKLLLHWGITPYVIEDKKLRNWETMSRVVAQDLGLNLKKKSIMLLSGFGHHADDNKPVIKLMTF